jgi:hypothetical protein
MATGRAGRRLTGSQQGHQRLSLLVDGINRGYGRRTIGFGLFPSEVREFKGHVPFRRVPENWGVLTVTPANPYPAQKQYKPRAPSSPEGAGLATSRRRAGPTPRHQFHENCENGASQEVGERDPGEIPPGRDFRQSALMNSHRQADEPRRRLPHGAPAENDTRHSAGCAGHNSRRTPHRPWLENRAFGRRLRDDRRPLLQLLQTPVWAPIEQPSEGSRPNSGSAVAIARLPRFTYIDGRRHCSLRRGICCRGGSTFAPALCFPTP